MFSLNLFLGVVLCSFLWNANQAEAQDCGCNGDPNASNVTCPNPCPKTCTNYMLPPAVCPRLCLRFGCECNTDYVLDEATGLCVLPQDCPIGCGGDINAEFAPCGDNCPRTCDNIGENIVCPQFCILGGGCACKPGYVRGGGPLNMCILPDQCPSGCGGDPNAVFSTCGDSCPITCHNFNNPPICPFCLIGPGGCRCQPGYVLDDNGQCILPTECPAGECTCGVNEHYEACPLTCPPETCDAIGKIYHCPLEPPNPCEPGCRCDANYTRNGNNTCIPIGECPATECTCGVNEHYEKCPFTCPPETCDAIGKSYSCPVEPPNPCRPECRCDENYRRDENGICIPIEDCPVSDCTCGVNEHYEKCPNTCPPETCAAIGKIFFCPVEPPNPCRPGCRCDDNYKRDDNGICIPIEDCTNCGGDPNARFYTCGWCQQTCANIGNQLACTDLCRLPGSCGCNPGYLLNDAGICVLPDQCPQSCSCPFEVWSECGALCQRTCQFPNGLFCPDLCRGGCICTEGYVRNGTGNCIEPCECP